MKKLIAPALMLVAAAALMFSLAACGGSNEAVQDDSSADETTVATEAALSYTTEASGPYASGKHHAVLTVEGYDPVSIELNADAAPVSVSNFCTLASDGYYDGLAFYRLVEDFCLQGGTKGNDAAGNDTSLTPIVGEFAENGIDNAMADDFQKGTVAMARTSEPNSATSTFFITLGDGDEVGLSLNGQYAAFGTIDPDGMKTIDKIVADHAKYAPQDGMGVIDSEANMPVIESITLTD